MCCKLMFVRLLSKSMCSLDGERACCTELGFMLQPESRGFVEALSTNTYLCSPYPWIIPVWLIKIWELMVWNVWSVPGMSMAKCRAFWPWTSWKKTRLVIGKWRAWRLARISSRCLSSSVNFWVWNQRWHHCQHIDWWWLVNAMLRKAPSMPCTSSTDIRVDYHDMPHVQSAIAKTGFRRLLNEWRILGQMSWREITWGQGNISVVQSLQHCEVKKGGRFAKMSKSTRGYGLVWTHPCLKRTKGKPFQDIARGCRVLMKIRIVLFLRSFFLGSGRRNM